MYVDGATLAALIGAMVSDLVQQHRARRLERRLVRLSQSRRAQLRITGSYPVTDRRGRVVAVMHTRRAR